MPLPDAAPYNGAMGVHHSPDFLIVGQGLAGSLLALALQARGASVEVLDNGHRSSATRVAAGLMNPVMGARLSLVRDADRCLVTARSAYDAIGAARGTVLYQPLEMARLLRGEREFRAWERRAADPAYRDRISGFRPPGHDPDFNDPHGSFRIFQTGFLRTGLLLDAVRDRLRATGALRLAEVSAAELRATAAGVRFAGRTPGTVVFCEGFRGGANPWFSWLPFRPLKGQILTLRTDRPLPRRIANGGAWLLPVSERLCRVGATHEHGVTDLGTSLAARQRLLEAVPRLLRRPPAVTPVAQRAGVRPQMADRQPVMGRHSDHPEIAIFNGFGARGSLLVPWFAELFAEQLLGRATVPDYAALERFGSPPCSP